MKSIRSWLESLGLPQYAEAFESNDVDEGILKTLSEQDLKDLGVASLGHRRKLLAAIASIGEYRLPPQILWQLQPPSGGS